jgi:hypothetical protein
MPGSDPEDPFEDRFTPGCPRAALDERDDAGGALSMAPTVACNRFGVN